MKNICLLVFLSCLLGSISAGANELVFPKDVACGPSDYTGRIAWINEINGQRVVVLKRPFGNYLCDLKTENTGVVTCKTIGEPVGAMPYQIDVLYSQSRDRWVIIIAKEYHYACDGLISNLQ